MVYDKANDEHQAPCSATPLQACKRKCNMRQIPLGIAKTAFRPVLGLPTTACEVGLPHSTSARYVLISRMRTRDGIANTMHGAVEH
jgi:hypothetical protein